MTDRARELVEFLRGHHIWCTARDGRFKLAADFIEQSLTKKGLKIVRAKPVVFEPDEALTPPEGARPSDATKRMAKTLGAEFILNSDTPEGDTVSEGARNIHVELRHWFFQKLNPQQRSDFLTAAGVAPRTCDLTLGMQYQAIGIIAAALQSRVSPQAGMREALEVARRALSAVLGFPKGAALSENALDLCEQAFVGIDAALQSPSTD